MISGFEALRSIENAYAKTRDDEMRLDVALRSSSEECARLRQDRLKLLHDLAQVKYRLISTGDLARDLDLAERQVKELLDRATAEAAEAEAQRQQAAELLKRAEAARTEAAAEYEAAADALRAFENEQTPRIASRADWKALNEAFERQHNIWQEAEKKNQQSETDRDIKRIPYENDPLFMYLWKRQFGTTAYASGFFVRHFDNMIAQLIGYHQARVDYAMLNAIPDRLREHVNRLKDGLDKSQNERAALRQQQLLAAGAAPLQERLLRAKAAQDENEKAATQAATAFEASDRKYDEIIGRNKEGLFAKAISLMVENDSRDDVATLYREAERTRTKEDQEIVKKIDHLSRALARAEQESADIRAHIREIAGRRTELEHARATFRQRGYNYPGTVFTNEASFNDVLGGVLDGVIKGAVLEQILQQGYRRPPSIDWGGGYQPDPIFPSDNDTFGGDGPSGDGFSTGGEF